MGLPSATELLNAWDAARPRSQQAEMGMSKLGSCRRQAGYHLQGYPADEGFEGDKIQAILGTAVHEALAAAARQVLPRARTESLEVRFGGLTGHPDLIVDGVLRDYKTVGYAMVLEQRRQLGPPQRERFQAHTYGAGAILAGHEVHTVQIDYIARDSGEEYLFTEPFSMEVVEQAMAWLDEVRHAEVETLPRDFRPASAFCRSCPFFERCWDAPRGTDDRRVLFRDNPDISAWAEVLAVAPLDRKQAEREEDDAKGALDALRTITQPGQTEYLEVPGEDVMIKFAVYKGRTSPDMAVIAADYKRAGGFRPPMRTGEPVIRVSLVGRKPGDGERGRNDRSEG